MFWAQTSFLLHHFWRKEEKGAQTSGETIGKWGTAHISREIFGQGVKGHTVNHVEINVLFIVFVDQIKGVNVEKKETSDDDEKRITTH